MIYNEKKVSRMRSHWVTPSFFMNEKSNLCIFAES